MSVLVGLELAEAGLLRVEAWVLRRVARRPPQWPELGAGVGLLVLVLVVLA